MPIYWESLSSSLADEALGKTAIGFIRVTLYVCESGVNRKYRNKIGIPYRRRAVGQNGEKKHICGK